MSDSVQDLTAIPYEFGKKLFPSIVEGKINTVEFLEACKGVLSLISKMGNVFLPLHSDVSSNIQKIWKSYEKNPEEYVYIEDLILCEKSAKDGILLDAFLWLQRALHFSLLFFQNIINDHKKSENLQEHLALAYSQTLKPYHNWLTQKLFKFFKNLLPQRSDLLCRISDGKHKGSEGVLHFLEIYFHGLSETVQHISAFFELHNLDSRAKV